jgi:TolA-binding protein/predicted nucleic acid-binding Zn finger protein
MAETEHITVAEVSEGPGGGGDPGTDVSLPVVELLTGRGFVTGKSGSGKSNTASVVAEKLLDNGFGLLIVDIDGEYYGLKEEYEILHAGADEECDIQITAEHAEKMASLALEQNVPIILDISSFLDESEAEEVLTAVARHLFAKAKKQKQPFLMLVEEVHEYIPEGGSVGECGKMLIKIGKRGRKHGLGIVGISQRPADVKKDFITQCDWLVWHRLTWNNDTKVVSRILDSEYAAAVEDLDDGEGFLMTDWAEAVRRVQFQRKQTFDAGATPGLDDFERPDLKSVSDNLVSELQEISEEQQARDDRIAELREELDAKNSRIAELEAELQDARDMSRMADQFTDALVRHVEGANPGKTERERMRERRQRTNGESEEAPVAAVAGDGGAGSENRDSTASKPAGDGTPANGDDGETGAVGGDAVAAVAAAVDAADADSDEGGTDSEDVSETGDDTDRSAHGADGADGSAEDAEDGAGFSAEEVLSRLSSVSETQTEDEEPKATADGGATVDPPGGDILDPEETDAAPGEPDDDGIIDGDSTAPPEFRDGITSRGGSEYDIIDAEDDVDTDTVGDDEPLVVRELKADIAAMETKTRKMLSFYRQFGPGTPLNAHFAAGGDGDRTQAYARNRTLRTRGLIEHVGRGQYDYRLRDLLEAEFDGHVDADVIEEYADNVEAKTLGDTEVDDETAE